MKHKHTFKIGLLFLLFGVGPLLINTAGLEFGWFDNVSMLLGMLGWVCLPAAIILFIIGFVQYIKTRSKK